MNGFEKRAEIKRKQILEASFRLMNCPEGVRSFIIDKVAEEAKVSKATIFKYFGNKDNLIYEVFRYYLDMMGTEAKSIIAENKPFEETLIAITHNKINYLNKVHNQFYLDMMEHLTRIGEDGLSKLMQQYQTESFHLMLDIFHRGRKEGKIALKYSDEFLMIYFQALVEGISNPQIYTKVLPYTEEWTELLLKGIAP